MPYGQTNPNPVGRGLPQSGVVLITTLWVLLLLSLIAGNMSQAGRGFARQTLNMVQAVKAGQAADGALVWALWSLQQPHGWLADGSEHNMTLGDVDLTIALVDESGKLDLNAAPTELLDALLEPAVPESGRRAALVAAIEDWRDEDDLVRLNGAEEKEYLAAGREKGPANAPFSEVIEVLNVLGMDLSIYRQISGSLTIMTGSSTINPQVASFNVLMTLPNASEGVVQSYIDARRVAWDNELELPPLPFDAEPYVNDSRSGRFYTSVTRAVIEPVTDMKQVVRITRGGNASRVEPVDTLIDLYDGAPDGGGAL